MKVLSDEEWRAVYAQWKQANPQYATLGSRLALIRGCLRKVLYENRAEAMVVVQQMVIFPGKVLHSYECEICGGWHIGNTDLWWLRRK